MLDVSVESKNFVPMESVISVIPTGIKKKMENRQRRSVRSGNFFYLQFTWCFQRRIQDFSKESDFCKRG